MLVRSLYFAVFADVVRSDPRIVLVDVHVGAAVLGLHFLKHLVRPIVGIALGLRFCTRFGGFFFGAAFSFFAALHCLHTARFRTTPTAGTLLTCGASGGPQPST